MKWILGIALVMLSAMRPAQTPDFRSTSSKVESYETRPGVLATPVYSSTGALCQLSFEQRHVQKDAVHLQSEMRHELVLEIIDELAPRYVRGNPKWQIDGHEYLDITSGTSETAVADYENVSVQIFK